MQALLAPVRNRIVEAIHQKTFPAPNPTPKIHTLGWFRRRQQTLEGAAAIDLEKKQIGIERLQGICCSQLCGIGHITARIKQVFIGIKHAISGDVKFSVRHFVETFLDQAAIVPKKHAKKAGTSPYPASIAVSNGLETA